MDNVIPESLNLITDQTILWFKKPEINVNSLSNEFRCFDVACLIHIYKNEIKDTYEFIFTVLGNLASVSGMKIQTRILVVIGSKCVQVEKKLVVIMEQATLIFSAPYGTIDSLIPYAYPVDIKVIKVVLKMVSQPTCERLLATQNPNSHADRPHQLFADAPPTAGGPMSMPTHIVAPPPSMPPPELPPPSSIPMSSPTILTSTGVTLPPPPPLPPSSLPPPPPVRPPAPPPPTSFPSAPPHHPAIHNPFFHLRENIEMMENLHPRIVLMSSANRSHHTTDELHDKESDINLNSVEQDLSMELKRRKLNFSESEPCTSDADFPGCHFPNKSDCVASQERLLATQNPNSHADRPHQLFADAPPTAGGPMSMPTHIVAPPPSMPPPELPPPSSIPMSSPTILTSTGVTLPPPPPLPPSSLPPPPPVRPPAPPPPTSFPSAPPHHPAIHNPFFHLRENIEMMENLHPRIVLMSSANRSHHTTDELHACDNSIDLNVDDQLEVAENINSVTEDHYDDV